MTDHDLIRELDELRENAARDSASLDWYASKLGEHKRELEAAVARANQLEKANGVLQRMVREEYPDGFSLAEIASTWGNATPEEIAALAGVPAESATEENEA